MREEPGLIAELRTARRWGVPLSVFRGQRDPGSKWTAKDAQAAILLEEYEAGLCKGCGFPHDETTDPATYNRWHAEPVLCFACETRDVVADRVAKNEDNKAPGAFSYRITLGPELRRPKD